MFKYIKSSLLIFSFLILSHLSFSQYQFQLYQNTPVKVGSQNLSLPWVGGLNGVQYSQMDLDGDNSEDLIAYDRSSKLIHCFLLKGGQYEYAPAYNDFFPEEIFNFLILADFNADGKKDLFTAGNLGMIAYKNVGANNIPQWEKQSNFLTYESKSGNEVNLQLINNDYPNISDIDNDGDIDILAFNTSGLESTIVFYKNLSIEQGQSPNMDILIEEETRWGNFEECNCGSFAFDTEDCNISQQERGALHAGGKSVFAEYLDDDNTIDLITSHQECSELYSYKGASTGINPKYSDVSTSFPNSTNPAAFNYYPNTMAISNNTDQKDLIISPNLEAQLSIAINYKSSNWLYTKDENGDYTLKTKAFLQEDMIDLGIQASPSLFDYDNDNDLDLFVAYTNTDENNTIYSGIALFENVGDASSPSFSLINEDYLNFNSTNFSNLLIQFTDLNKDGEIDLAFQATENGQNALYTCISQNGQIDINNRNVIDNVFIGFGYSFHFVEVSDANKCDLLIGKSSGGLIHYENIGTLDNPSFEQANNTYLSISDDFFRSSLKLTSSDIDADGSTDLIVADQSGLIKVYSDFKSETEEFDTLYAYNEIQKSFSKTGLGSKNTLTAGFLYDSKYPTLITGSISGGLSVLRNVSEYPVEESASETKFSFYPNPNNGSNLTIELKEAATISIITLSGEVVINDLKLQAGYSSVTLESLKEGLYIISASFDKNTFEIKKLLIKH